MIVNTQRLFVHLLPALRVDTVCDIGSMDGTDALRFRATLPAASIYAFEAHPQNARSMQTDGRLAAKAIDVLPLAITDFDGEADFFMTGAVYEGESWRGMSSLYRRVHGTEALTRTSVRTGRLDTVLGKRLPSAARLALWIDTEGKAYEVIQGAAGILDRVWLVHTEVETLPCIGAEQKFYPQVKALLEARGFIQLATDQATQNPQFNALFVRAGLPAPQQLRVRLRSMQARLRRAAVNLVRQCFPQFVRWYVRRHR